MKVYRYQQIDYGIDWSGFDWETLTECLYFPERGVLSWGSSERHFSGSSQSISEAEKIIEELRGRKQITPKRDPFVSRYNYIGEIDLPEEIAIGFISAYDEKNRTTQLFDGKVKDLVDLCSKMPAVKV